MISKRRSYN